MRSGEASRYKRKRHEHSLDTPLDSRPAATRAPLPAACDVLVVGGGINGAGIARDLAGRGLTVLLCEKDDLARHTSSSSTKLIHGGIRYLEYYEFSLVRKALAEREGFFRSAPHITRPMRFVMPHDPAMRPAWMLRAGLFLYDHLARREWLPGSESIDLSRHAAGGPLNPGWRRAFAYSDGWVDDARLVVLCAIDAAERGARILTRTRCTGARRTAGGWQVTLEPGGGRTHALTARALVNAAGPWAAQFLTEHAGLPDRRNLRLVKGSHIVVPRMFDHGYTYLFQNPDKRVIFAIPYEGDFTLIGTTDVEHRGPVGTAAIDASEVAYLCEQASRYFAQPVRPSQVVWSYAGVRPLLADDAESAAAVTRDYLLELDAAGAPLLNVWGGKITTFRRLAEEAADLLAAPLGAPRGAWTRDAVLPGGDLSALIRPSGRPDVDLAQFSEALARRHPHWGAALAQRLARCHGGRVALFAGDRGDLGAEVARGLHEAELHYLHAHEWARAPDDVLWRRTKLGLHLDAAGRRSVEDWWQRHYPNDATAAEPAMEGTWS